MLLRVNRSCWSLHNLWLEAVWCRHDKPPYFSDATTVLMLHIREMWSSFAPSRRREQDLERRITQGSQSSPSTKILAGGDDKRGNARATSRECLTYMLLDTTPLPSSRFFSRCFLRLAASRLRRHMGLAPWSRLAARIFGQRRALWPNPGTTVAAECCMFET